MNEETVGLKRKLRKQYKKLRADTPENQRRTWDAAIAERLYATDFYRDASSVFLFVSFEDEIDTLRIIDRALADGKRVAAPTCLDRNGRMEFYLIRSRTEFIVSSFGISEPFPDPKKLAVPDASSICLVPGLSFDRLGHRLGYGGGFYDRFLARFPGIRAGLCYEQAISDELPHESFDLPVEWVVTESRLIHID